MATGKPKYCGDMPQLGINFHRITLQLRGATGKSGSDSLRQRPNGANMSRRGQWLAAEGEVSA